MSDVLNTYRRASWQVRHFAQIDSTNDWLLAAGRDGAVARSVALADEQTAGRGRLDRRWHAPPGTCLLMSLLFRPPEPFATYAPRITMFCGLALVDAVAGVAGVDVQLKWPNDLIVARDGTWRKVAGMLSEVGSDEGAPSFLVVGIGLNVNVPSAGVPALDPNATSLLAECGEFVDRAALLDAFLARVEIREAALLSGEDPLREWQARLAWMGRPVQVRTPIEVVRGIAAGVDAEGALCLHLPDGALRRFAVGDVSLRL